ncbi:MAG TPA: hypothetical protein VK929_12895 [Longimicrobiales bacterium]|nr:hypothetical protein [Longimicrobiales bacterium]
MSLTGRLLTTVSAILAGVVAGTACTRADTDTDGTALAAAEHTPAHVDSVFPIAEEIQRFRAELPARATELSGGSGDMAGLVQRFMAALESRDGRELDAMMITPAEFIDLYYPHSRFTERPYEMAPQLVWFQLENYGSRGLNRALERFGGRDLGWHAWSCDNVTVEGPNRIHGNCVVSIRDAERGTGDVSLFGQVLERDGLFKFINYANGL